MKTGSDKQGWMPTLTLAKLFEEQNQFLDALAAYELISQTDSSPAVRQKIEALHLRILTDPNARYDPRIEKLFSPEELAYLKILNHSAFDNLSQVVNRMQEGLDETDFVFEPEVEIAPEEANDLQSILSEIEQHAQQTEILGLEDATEFNTADLIMALLSRYGKDTLLRDIKLADFLSLVADMQNRRRKND
ncbi:MAG: hypothetical protein FJ042_00110 [Candidatus Cloacimonetes bacterium]|nr:hypothetical protein [Candidatus Cloacimonadota bacterium]